MMVAMDEIVSIRNFFASYHIQLSTEWLQSCVNWCKEETLPPNYTIKDLQIKVYEQWLLLDLRDVEIRNLPPDLSIKKEYSLTGNHALQLMKVVDISKPKQWQLQRIRNNVSKNVDDQTESSKRVLQLTLTDGVQEVEAMEYKPIPALNLNLTPGIKILLTGPISVRRGRLMLQSNNVKVLGGEVEELMVENAAENVLARSLNLPLNPNPKVIEESLLCANKDMFNETGVTTRTVPQNQTNNITNQQNMQMPIRRDPSTVSVTRPVVQNRAKPTEELQDFSAEEEMRIAAEIESLMEVEREFEDSMNSKQPASKTPDMFDDMDINDYDFSNINVPTTVIKTNNVPSRGLTTVEKKLATTTAHKSPSIINISDSMEMEDDVFENIDIDAHLDQVDKDRDKETQHKATPQKSVILTIDKLLKNIPNISNGKFKIKATFKSIVERLTIKDYGFHLVVVVEDESNHITVRFHSDVVADLAECDPNTLLSLKTGVLENNAEAERKILEVIKRIKEKLLLLDNVIEVQINVREKYPVVVNILDIL